MAGWGYTQKNGPETWGKEFPLAVQGVRQSPIDICLASCEDDSTLPPLVAKFEPLNGLPIDNTGASWKVDYEPTKTSLTGGPLTGEYQLVQMHAHWGKQEGRGSEHTLDGKMYDGELHLVHYNTAYGSFAEAADKPDGLAVLGVFLQAGESGHAEFGKITSMLASIKKKGDKAVLQAQLDPAALLPVCENYMTYPGSLTTPPLFESVTWLVYDTPITVSKEQMEAMRSMKVGCEDDCDCMVDNYRPVCGKGARVVKKAKA